jgi:ketosteroid isomerase-like protein
MTTRRDEAWFDRLAIEDVTVRYSDAVNRGDWDAFEATWMPDAVWEESHPVSTHIVGARAIREHVAALIDKADFMMQVTHGTVVDFVAEDHASTTTSSTPWPGPRVCRS